MQAYTFPKTGDDEWTNAETGVRIVRFPSISRLVFEVRIPMLNAAGWQHGAYRKSLAAARQIASVFADQARVATAAAHAEALTEYAERAKAGEDETVHLWDGTAAPSACGVDIMHTAYTYGSPEHDEVTCPACLAS